MPDPHEIFASSLLVVSEHATPVQTTTNEPLKIDQF